MRERILLTGATGFIGPRLSEKLVKNGYDVWWLLRYVTGRYVLGEGVKTVFADIKDYNGVMQAMRLVRPHRIIHLAAISPVAYSYEHPMEVTETNYQGTIHLAEAARKEAPELKQFLFAGTSEEYGNQERFPIRENAHIYPNSPYAIAKAASTLYLEYMRDAYKFPITVCRPFNTYGRTKNLHFVTERIISQMLRGERKVKLGDPDAVRDLMYVDDHVNAYMKCLCSKAIGEVFNFCTGEGYTIMELVDLIAEYTDWVGKVVWHTIPQRPLDIHTLIGDNTKAKTKLKWKPHNSLHMGLAKTINDLKPLIK